MEAGFMTGKMLINLDSEDEGQIFVSCAGGQTIHATFEFEREQAPAGYFFITLVMTSTRSAPMPSNFSSASCIWKWKSLTVTSD